MSAPVPSPSRHAPFRAPSFRTHDDAHPQPCTPHCDWLQSSPRHLSNPSTSKEIERERGGGGGRASKALTPAFCQVMLSHVKPTDRNHAVLLGISELLPRMTKLVVRRVPMTRMLEEEILAELPEVRRSIPVGKRMKVCVRERESEILAIGQSRAHSLQLLLPIRAAHSAAFPLVDSLVLPGRAGTVPRASGSHGPGK